MEEEESSSYRLVSTASSGSPRAIRSCSNIAKGVRFVDCRGGRDGCGVVVEEGGREDVRSERAAEREWGPLGGGGGSMSVEGVFCG